MINSFFCFRNNIFLSGLFGGLVVFVLIILGQVLSYISPLFLFLWGPFITLPISFVAFNFGTFASFITIGSAFIFLFFSSSFYLALGYSFFLFFPVFLGIWLLGLRAQSIDNTDGTLHYHWYPLSYVLLYLAIFIVVSSALLLFLCEQNANFLEFLHLLQSILSKNLTLFFETNHQDFDNTLLEVNIKENFVAILLSCIVISAISNIIFSLYTALRLGCKYGWTKRPFLPWPQTFRIPTFGLIYFIGSWTIYILVPNFLPNFIFSSLFCMGFLFILSGFFYFHALTLALPYRFMLLFVLYFSLITNVFFSSLIFLFLFFLGIFATIRYEKLNINFISTIK